MNFWIFILCFIKIFSGPLVFLIVMQYYDFNISAFYISETPKKEAFEEEVA